MAKLSILVAFICACCAKAFTSSCGEVTRTTERTQLSMETSSNRRAFIGNVALATGATASAALLAPQPAFAAFGKEYVPKFDDLKQIYSLGVSLDRLKDSVANDQGKALSGLVAFNKDPNFYTGYARNYISKSVKNNAEGDKRVGYIRQASGLIGSCQGLLEGREGIEVPGPAGTEALKRVSKAQALIGQFLTESGVEDQKITDYAAKYN